MRVAGALLVALWLAHPTTAQGRSLPEDNYRLHCSGCHLADGGGVEGTVPSLRSVGPLLREPGGREYLIRVPGVAQAPLDDASLAELMNWILREFAREETFVPYSVRDIARWRRRPLRDPLSARPKPLADE